MIPRFLALLACAACLSASAFSPLGPMSMPSRPAETRPMDILGFRAPGLEPTQLVAFGPLLEKRDAASDEDSGRVRIGSVRELDKAARVDTWQPIPGGYVARLHVSSQGAAGLRVKLSLGPVPGAIE